MFWAPFYPVLPPASRSGLQRISSTNGASGQRSLPVFRLPNVKNWRVLRHLRATGSVPGIATLAHAREARPEVHLKCNQATALAGRSSIAPMSILAFNLAITAAIYFKPLRARRPGRSPEYGSLAFAHDRSSRRQR
jgi:hypothetical protein